MEQPSEYNYYYVFVIYEYKFSDYCVIGVNEKINYLDTLCLYLKKYGKYAFLLYEGETTVYAECIDSSTWKYLRDSDAKSIFCDMEPDYRDDFNDLQSSLTSIDDFVIKYPNIVDIEMISDEEYDLYENELDSLDAFFKYICENID